MIPVIIIVLILFVLGMLGFSPLFVLVIAGVAFFLGGILVILLSGQEMKPSGPAMFWLGFILLVACGLISGANIAFARDPDGRYANSPLKGWFDSLRSGKGPCCSDADGTALADVDWESKDGHYRVRIEGEWFNVPDDAVITEPNRAGRTMVWPMYERGVGMPLKVHIRCFLPGSMT